MQYKAPAPSYDKRAYQTIFPQYLDASLTPSEGRRLTKSQSVENPQVEEIATALNQLGYKDILIERSASLPCSQASERFAFVPRGCVRVAIKRPIGEHYVRKSDFDTQTRGLVVEDITSKQAVLRRVAEIVKSSGGPRPQLPTVAAATASLMRKK